MCLQEVPDTCNLGLAINLDLCDILALRLSSNFECCTALAPRNGTDARIAAKNSRAQHAAQMLQLYGNTDACRWDFTFGADIINQIIEDPSVSGIDSPGVLPIGKAIATCFFSDNLKSCGPFCDDMTLRAEVRRWACSACLLDWISCGVVLRHPALCSYSPPACSLATPPTTPTALADRHVPDVGRVC